MFHKKHTVIKLDSTIRRVANLILLGHFTVFRHSSCVHLRRWTIKLPVAVGDYSVLFVEKLARSTPWEHVTQVLFRGPNGKLRRMTYFEAIHRVKNGTAHFYVTYHGRQVELELAHNALGEECLRASIGGKDVDVLLSLPDYRDGAD